LVLLNRDFLDWPCERVSFFSPFSDRLSWSRFSGWATFSQLVRAKSRSFLSPRAHYADVAHGSPPEEGVPLHIPRRKLKVFFPPPFCPPVLPATRGRIFLLMEGRPMTCPFFFLGWFKKNFFFVGARSSCGRSDYFPSRRMFTFSGFFLPLWSSGKKPFPRGGAPFFPLRPPRCGT